MENYPSKTNTICGIFCKYSFFNRRQEQTGGFPLNGKELHRRDNPWTYCKVSSAAHGVVGGKHRKKSDMQRGMVNGIEGFLKGTILDFEEALPGEKLNILI